MTTGTSVKWRLMGARVEVAGRVVGAIAEKTPRASKNMTAAIDTADMIIAASKKTAAGRKNADDFKAVLGTERIGYAILTQNVTFNT